MHFHLIFLLPESECNGCPAEYRRAGLPHSYTDLQVYSGNTQRIFPHHRCPSPADSARTSSVPGFPVSYLRPSSPQESAEYTDNYLEDCLSAHSGNDPELPEVPVRTSITDLQKESLPEALHNYSHSEK